MERDNWKNDQNIGGRFMKQPINIINKNKVKDSWIYSNNNENNHGEDLLSGYLWNPRSYICSFCKREFRSAQALGGHMNVHRRDRARLRQYSPPTRNSNHLFINLNLDPNPNPKSLFSSKFSSPSPNLSQRTNILPPIEAKKWVTESSQSHNYKGDQDLEKVNYSKSLFGVENIEGFGNENEFGILKKTQVIRLDLEIGLISGAKEGMDLELRLGR